MRVRESLKQTKEVLDGVEKILVNGVGIPEFQGLTGKFVFDTNGKVVAIQWGNSEWKARYSFVTYLLTEWDKGSNGYLELLCFQQSSEQSKVKLACRHLAEVLETLGLTD